MVSSLILIPAIVLLVILAGLCSGAETGIYQLSRLRLRLGVEKKKLPFVALSKAMRDGSSLLLSTLIGTSLAHYFATSIVTLMLVHRMRVEHTAELFATLIIAPTLFVCSELIPKNLFFYRADSLMPPLGPGLYAFQRLLVFSGIVPLLKFITRLFARLTGTRPSTMAVISDAREHHIDAILRETHEEGFLSPIQTDIMNRIVMVPNVRIRSVMTPTNKVRMVPHDSDRAALLEVLKKHVFTRLLVYESRPENVVGFVNIYEVLSSSESFTDLGGYLKPVRRLSADTTVFETIDIMRREKLQIVLVTRAGHLGRAKPLGIVTMKDVVEELLGELAEW
jgi:CBS domain containing-hemolysin-like protein